MSIGPLLWVEGIIGAGKTTLARQIAEALGFRAFHEPVESNPYLELFYKNPKEHAAFMQIHLLMERYAMQKEAAYACARGFGCVLDRGLPGDRVFAKLHFLAGNISQLQWNTYDKFFDIMSADLRPPSRLLFLDIEPEVALERVRSRKRGAESRMELKYLQDLKKGYLDLMCEIESGAHAWSKGMAVTRLPWNVDHQPIGPLVKMLRHEFELETPNNGLATTTSLGA